MDDTKPSSLGLFLRQRRHELKLSTRAVAERGGVNQAQVVRIENGTSAQPSPDTLRGLATALEVPLSDLWAMAGYHDAAELPGPLPYLRAKYRDLPDREMEALGRDVARVLAAHGISPSSGPADGEDETDDGLPPSSTRKEDHYEPRN